LRTNGSPLFERYDAATDIGRRLYVHDRVTSTMDMAWALAEAGAPHGDAVMAFAQTAGRGRFGRAWLSEPGGSLMLSVILRPSLDIASRLSMIGAVAVRRAVADLAGISCTFKWPNDVFAGGRKLCGILIDGRVDTGGGAVVVMGIGLNLNMRPADYPEIAAIATSVLVESGRRAAPEEAAVAVLRALDAVHAETGAEVLGEWRGALHMLGKRVSVSRRGGALDGIAEDVAADGALLLRDDVGALHRLESGEVTLRA